MDSKNVIDKAALERHQRMSEAQSVPAMIEQLGVDVGEITDLCVCVGYRNGQAITYNTAMTQAELCWFLRKMNHDADRAMFEAAPRAPLNRQDST